MSDGALIESAEIDTLRRVFKLIMALSGGRADALRLLQIRSLCSEPEDWRRLLAAIPLDKLSFQLDVGVQRPAAVTALSDWCTHFTRSNETHGYLSVLLITLVTMEGVHDCAGLCRPLVRRAEVSSALLKLYDPVAGECPPGSSYAKAWDSVQDAALELHRHGSTSFILSGLAEQSEGKRSKFALKCVLLPYANIPVIANKTRTYEDDHNSREGGRRVEHMVHVWASTSWWILMDFAEGSTLVEEVERIKHDPALPVFPGRRKRTVSPAGSVRLDLLRRLGLPLLTALGELHSRGKRHEDLSPTNIIVRRRDPGEGGPEYDVTFIDFGRNYLYLGAVGALEDSDAVFVAPEVRDNEDDVDHADVYSLGRILIMLGDVGENRDGTIPDQFYGQTPLVARLIEDLIDERPERRLLVFTTARQSLNVYLSLRQILEQELDVTQAELVDDLALRHRAIPNDRQSFVEILALIPPSREPKKRRRIYQLRRDQGTLADPRRSMYARWLLIFSMVASFGYVVTSLVCVYWFFRDIGIGITSPADELVLHAIGAKPDFIPLIDNLRHADYQLGNVWQNLPARIIGLSFSMAAVRYYQNIVGGLTTWVAHSPKLPGSTLRVGTESAIRMMTIWPLLFILGVNLVEVRWWPLASAMGYTWVIVANLLSTRFAMKYLALARERKLSTVPPKHQKITGLESYRQWVPTITIYSLAVWLLGALLYLGILKDVYVYAAVVALINIGVFFVIKTGMNAPDIRSGLNRCFLAAERLRYEADKVGPPQLPAPRLSRRSRRSPPRTPAVTGR